MDKNAKRSAGLTLIELMVTIAISSVVMSAAVTLFVSMSQVKREGERLLEVNTAGSIALAQVEFDLASAGYRWPSGTFGIRIWNDVDAATNIDGITTAANCGAPGFGLVPGSDVLEVASGYQVEPPGTILGVNYGPEVGPPAVGANQVRFSLLTPGYPFNGTEDGIDSVLMASDPAGNACLLRVNSAINYSGPSVVADYLDRDYAVEAAPAAKYLSPTAARCPRNNDRVYRLERRTRYFLCRDPGNPQQRPALYRQTTLANPPGNPVPLGAPQLMQEGLEDLQFAGRYQELVAAGLGAPAANCVTTGATYCTCNNANGGCTNLLPLPPVLNANSPLNWIRSVTVGLVSISTRLARDGQTANFIRPALLDHPVGTVQDGNKRIVRQRTIALQNLGMVTP